MTTTAERGTRGSLQAATSKATNHHQLHRLCSYCCCFCHCCWCCYGGGDAWCYLLKVVERPARQGHCAGMARARRGNTPRNTLALATARNKNVNKDWWRLRLKEKIILDLFYFRMQNDANTRMFCAKNRMHLVPEEAMKADLQLLQIATK